MRILGLTAFIHNSSAALLVDGSVIAAADEERFTREKFTGKFPRQAITFCLERAGINLAEVDALAFYWHPWLGTVQRALQMARSLPHSLAFFQTRAPGDHGAVRGDFGSWWKMVTVGRVTRASFPEERARFRTHHVEHHLAHAASAFYQSPWDESLILSLDGTGEWTTTLLARGTGRRIDKLCDIPYPHSLGALYGAITQYLGYQIYQDEWKVMGLAACGTPRYAPQVRRLIQFRDGAFRLDLNYFGFQLADKGAWYGPRFGELFGPPRRADESIESERFADLAASFQLVTEEIGLALVRHLLAVGGGCRKLCLAGGVGLNAVLNGKILSETAVESLFVQPAAGDNGASLGAALYLHHQLGGERTAPVRDVYLGPDFAEADILRAVTASGLRFERSDAIEQRAATLLAAGNVLGWFQGRMEYGPRALGNRSILADPRRAEMKDIVNEKVKFREAFRPFAPSVLLEHADNFFELPTHCRTFPFMTTVLPVRAEKRSDIPAVTHFDGTGRLQTVDSASSPRFHALIEHFYALTGIPVLLNTSFNLAGEPIVCTPEDAISTFLRSGLDVLVMGDYLCTKP